MDRKDLTSEQLKKAAACQSPEELLQLAKEEGYELSDEELEQVSGGWTPSAFEPIKCPACGSESVTFNAMIPGYVCGTCGQVFNTD